MLLLSHMITPKRPTGFHEFLPADQLAFDAMVTTIRQSYERFGYAPIETPALELASVLHAKEGGESAKQGYQFTKGDTDLALRFDLTIPLARYVAEHYHELAFPFRRYQIQDVWRAEKPQAGRYRQFYQCDIDIIGSRNVIADADVLIAMADAMRSLKLQSVLRFSNRKIFSGLLSALKLTKYSTEILRLLDKLDKAGPLKLKKSLLELGITSDNADRLLDTAAMKGSTAKILSYLYALEIENETFISGLNELEETAQLLDAAGLSDDQYIIDLGIFRGFDYYTGMVFEIALANRADIGSVGGGGRYDNLVGHYSKEELPGVGGSIGLSRLFAALQDDKKSHGASTPARALVVAFSHELLPYSLMVAKKLREAGLNIISYPGIEKAGKQLAYAAKLGVPYAVLCGEDEERAKTVTIKNLQSGEQKTLTLAKAIAALKA